MRQSNLKFNIAFTLFYFVIICPSYSINKIIEDEIAVNSNTVIDINFGNFLLKNLEIHTWDESKVKQIIEIDALPSQNEDYQSFLNIFNRKINPISSDSLKLNYNIVYRKASRLSDGKYNIRIKKGKPFTIEDFHVTVKLYVPKNNILVLKSLSSNIKLEELTNKATLKLYRVNLRANSVSEIDLNARYSDVSFTDINKAVIHSSQSKFKADKIAIANIDAKFTEFQIGSIGKLETLNSEFVKYYIKELDNISCPESRFSKFEIDKLISEMNVSSRNGDVIINEISPNFKAINITASTYSTISLGTSTLNQVNLKVDSMFPKWKIEDDLIEGDQQQKEDHQIREYYKGKSGFNQNIYIECKECEMIFN